MTRTAYMQKYAATHQEQARERKQDERDRRERLRSYWYAKLVHGREIPALKHGCSELLIEQERVRYEKTLDETK